MLSDLVVVEHTHLLYSQNSVSVEMMTKEHLINFYQSVDMLCEGPTSAFTHLQSDIFKRHI